MGRMSVDVIDGIRGAYKELHPGGVYAKGKGPEAKAYREKEEASDLWVKIERAEGGRMDLVFDGSVPLFWNKIAILKFISGLMVPGADNQLEKYLARFFSCNQVTAALRVNTLFKYIFSEPMRWLSGKAHELEGWSLDESSELMDLVEKMMVEVAADGKKLFDPAYDPFAPLAARHPEFAAWREKEMKRKVFAPDGTPYEIHKLVLEEARNPEQAGNKQATHRTVELAQEMANAALVAMRDPRRSISDLLASQVAK